MPEPIDDSSLVDLGIVYEYSRMPRPDPNRYGLSISEAADALDQRRRQRCTVARA